MKQNQYRIKGFKTPDRIFSKQMPSIDQSGINYNFQRTQSIFNSMIPSNINSNLQSFIKSQSKSNIKFNEMLSSSMATIKHNQLITPNTQRDNFNYLKCGKSETNKRKLNQMLQYQIQQLAKESTNSRQNLKLSSSIAIPKQIKSNSLGQLAQNAEILNYFILNSKKGIQIDSKNEQIENQSQEKKQSQVQKQIENDIKELSMQKKRLNDQFGRSSFQLKLQKIHENNKEIQQQAFQIVNSKKKIIIKDAKKIPFVDFTLLQKYSNYQQQIAKQQQQKTTAKINQDSYNFYYVIGRGGFGKVWIVQHKKTKQLFAMKEMSKILSKKSVNSVMNERKLLSNLKHPFLVNMVAAFQEQQTLYLVMELMSGGDLRYHIGRKRFFNEEQTKFFVCCIIQCLEYLHNRGIIHRDIKPENLVLDQEGYVHVTDLGIAREQCLNNSSDTSGTPGYMAPEVMCRQNHTIAVDYYAIGVIIYEFMLGRRPYLGKCRKEIREAILAKQVQISKREIPRTWSQEAADFANKVCSYFKLIIGQLLQRKPENRLGFNGPSEVKEHPWIKEFDWDMLQKKQLEAPFLPSVQSNIHFKFLQKNNDNFDEKQINIDDGITDDEMYQQNTMLLKTPEVQSQFFVQQINNNNNSDLFSNYTYDPVQNNIQNTYNSQGSTGSSFNNKIQKLLQ